MVHGDQLSGRDVPFGHAEAAPTGLVADLDGVAEAGEAGVRGKLLGGGGGVRRGGEPPFRWLVIAAVAAVAAVALLGQRRLPQLVQLLSPGLQSPTFQT